MKRALCSIISLVIVLNMFLSNIVVFAAFVFEDTSDENEARRIKDEIYALTDEYYELYHKNDGTGFSAFESNSYWWPIGSAETTEENGILFAKGDPESVTITSYFGKRVLNGVEGYHGGIDIGRVRMGETNVIASKSGVVIYPTSDGQVSFPTGYLGNHTDGGGYGNYVMIQHSNGDITVYAHLYQDTITVRAGDSVSQGQVIGKTGSSGNSTGTHLHFEIRVNQQRVDPLLYVNPDDPRPASSGGNFPVTGTSLTKDEYVSLLESYASSHQSDFWSLFSSNASFIYEIAAAEGVNPELVVVTAIVETGSGSSMCGKNNYWGIGCTNTGGSISYSSFEDGVRAYCSLLKSYMTGSTANRINAIAQEREAAGCNPAGYGPPDTYVGIQSLYSNVGTYRYNPGDSSRGGCYYLNHWMYEDNYCSNVPTCEGVRDANGKYTYPSCPENSRTTICEQNDYTIYQVNQKAQLRQNVFGI